jgi:uncharacterized protein YjiS (DUF1127 family)
MRGPQGCFPFSRLLGEQGGAYLWRRRTIEQDRKESNAMLSALIAAIARRRARLIAIAELERMSDHRLRDIGLSRDQIQAFVSGQL